jgi:predicted O-methyltransferase YrrM
MRRETVHRRPACPEPERWAARDDYATETAVTSWIAALVAMVKPDLVIETGSYLGDTAVAIAEALKAEGRGRLVTCEPVPARADSVQARANGLPMTVWAASSLTYVPDGPVDLVFADSEFVLRGPEIRYFATWASNKAVVVLHDTTLCGYPGHAQLIHDMQKLVDDGVITPWTLFETPRGVGVARFRGAS